MHILVAAPFGLLIWISCMVYAAISGGEWQIVAILGPVIVSGAIAIFVSFGIIVQLIAKAVKSSI